MTQFLRIHRALFRHDAPNWARAESTSGRTTAWLGLAFLIIALVVLGRRAATADDLATFGSYAGWTLLATAIVATVPLAAVLEWRFIFGLLRRPCRFGPLYGTVAVMVLWQNAVNHWVGLAVGARRLIVRHGLSTQNVLRLMTVDQLAELTARLLFTLAVVLATAMPRAAPTAAAWGLLGVALLFAMLRFLAGRTLRRWVRRITWLRLPLALVRPFARTLTGPTTIACVGLAIGKKLIRGAAVYVLQLGLQIDCPAATAWQSIVALDWATAVPVVPGHFGVYQAAVAALYGTLGYGYESGLLVGTCYHLAHLGAALVPGAVVSATEAWRRLERPAPTPTPFHEQDRGAATVSPPPTTAPVRG